MAIKNPLRADHTANDFYIWRVVSADNSTPLMYGLKRAKDGVVSTENASLLVKRDKMLNQIHTTVGTREEIVAQGLTREAAAAQISELRADCKKSSNAIRKIARASLHTARLAKRAH